MEAGAVCPSNCGEVVDLSGDTDHVLLPRAPYHVLLSEVADLSGDADHVLLPHPPRRGVCHQGPVWLSLYPAAYLSPINHPFLLI